MRLATKEDVPALIGLLHEAVAAVNHVPVINDNLAAEWFEGHIEAGNAYLSDDGLSTISIRKGSVPFSDEVFTKIDWLFSSEKANGHDLVNVLPQLPGRVLFTNDWGNAEQFDRLMRTKGFDRIGGIYMKGYKK